MPNLTMEYLNHFVAVNGPGFRPRIGCVATVWGVPDSDSLVSIQ